MTDFLDAVTAAAESDRAAVAAVLDEAGVVLAPTAPTPHILKISRVCFSGTKHLEGHEPEDFVYDRSMGPGLWVVASNHNLAGKSTILNVIRWALTGRTGRLRDDVRSWIAAVTVEGSIDDQTFVIDFTDDGAPRGTLTDYGQPAGTFSGDDEFEALTGAFFSDRLGLDPTPFWQRREGGDESEGDARRLGWQGYFPALHVRSGSGPLLGEQVQGGQAGTLMQVFLGLPWALTAATARVGRRVVQRDLNAMRRRARDDRQAREAAREPLRNQLDTARARLAALEAQGAAPTPAEIDQRMSRYNTAATALSAVQDEVRAARATLSLTTDAVDAATRRHLALKETAVIRPLLGRIAPTECPRCTHHLEDVKEHREAEDHCFVCDAPLQDVVEDEAEVAEAEQELADAQAAHAIAIAELDAAAAREAELQIEHDTARAAVAQIDTQAPAIAERAEVVQQIAVAEALLEQGTQLDATDDAHDDLALREKILGVAQGEAENRRAEAARDFLQRLGSEVVDLGKRFGMPNLEAADPKLGATMKLTIGGAESNFGSLTPGEQLRVRIATLIGLLRIGVDLGIGRFPGLLLIDSPGSEEMVEADAAEILAEITAIAAEQDHLQVIVATARPELIGDLAGGDRFIGGADLGMVF